MYCIVSIFIIDKDFFDKSNPILKFTSVIPERYGDPYPVDVKKVQFRTSQTYDVSGLLEPYMFMTKFQKINGTLVLTQALMVDIQPCTEDLLSPELIKIIEKPSDFYFQILSKQTPH